MKIAPSRAEAEIADVQAFADSRHLAIDQVGIRRLRHPLGVVGRAGRVQQTVAVSSMYVGLPEDRKGTHMSRFIAMLHSPQLTVSSASLPDLLATMLANLEAASGHIEMAFPYFVSKKAPVSGVESLLDYAVGLVGEIDQSGVRNRLRVTVPVTSLCPCSKKISAYGAHNQRSHVTVSALLNEAMPPEDLIELIEQQASAELFALLKRPDEKFVTERAYDNPKFVEDMVRDVAAALNSEARIAAYRVETENFESIHNHSAYAQISRS